MKKLLLSLAVVLALAIGSFAFFNAWVYPPFGLTSYAKADHQQAWEKAARGFCESSGLSYLGPDFIKYRQVEAGDEAYAWGVARAATASGRERLVWIYLEWSTKRSLWTRNYCLVLADDDDEVYYTPVFPGQFDRASIALAKILKENARHVREYANTRNH